MMRTRIGVLSLLSLAIVSAGCTCGGDLVNRGAELRANPQTLDFESREIGSQTTLRITFTNAGNAPLTFLSTTVEGADMSAFTLGSMPAASLASGESTTLDVTFHATRVGAFSARLTVTSDAKFTPELSVPLVATSRMGFDAGMPDSGTHDAGVEVDAGFDAGVEIDAGFDAGVEVDAGVLDAGCEVLLCGRAAAGVTCVEISHETFGATWTTQLFNDASGWNTAATGRTVRFGDVNGDGRADVCGRGSLGVNCALNSGTTFGAFTTFTTEFSNAQGWNDGPQYFATVQLADLNADGADEVCGRSDAGVECVFADGGVWRSTSFNDATGWALAKYYPSVQFADVSGDGRADACARGELGISCSLSADGGFGVYTGWSTEFSDADDWDAAPQYFQTVQFPDVNGDGKADVCARSAAGISCGLSNGTQFAASATWSTAFGDASGWATRSQFATIQFPDLDGDGKADVCGRASAGLVCAISSGTAFGAAMTTQLFNDASGWGGDSTYFSTIQFVDLDGDGDLDVCGRGSMGINCAKWNQGAFGTQVLVSAFGSDTDGWSDENRAPTLRFVANGSSSCRIGPRATPAVRVGP